jgi:parallel beta-helix repeat protein
MGCKITSNKMTGVFVRDGGNAVLRDNTVSGNGDFGVALLVRGGGALAGACSLRTLGGAQACGGWGPKGQGSNCLLGWATEVAGPTAGQSPQLGARPAL